jgi:flagellar basal-body rod protein FlgF
MNVAVYTVTSAGLAAQARLDAVTQNLANAGTPGYKAVRLLLREATLDPEETALSQAARALVVEVATVHDFSQGPVRQSGNPLDVAITGDGFFAVATERGERYTRQGNFALDREGHLVTAQGHRVRGEQGDLRLPPGDVTFGEDGSVSVDGAVVGRLKLVGFGDPPALVPEGESLFAPASEAAGVPLEAPSVRLRPGAIEGANVDAVASMIELVDVARGYESYVQALGRLDEVEQQSINEVGRT